MECPDFVGEGRCPPPVAVLGGAGIVGRHHGQPGHGRFRRGRRTDTALARLEQVTNAPDAIIFASQVQDLHPDWSRLAARPEVAQVAVWDLFFCNVDGQAGAVLALGLDEKMSRRIVYFQASAIAIVGLAIGVPLGLAAGRWGWSEVTSRVPLVDIPPLSALVVLLAIPVVLVASATVAIGPARSVARARPAEALRTE